MLPRVTPADQFMGWIALLVGIAAMFGMVWAFMRAGKTRNIGIVLLWAALGLALLCFAGFSGCIALFTIGGTRIGG
jgi:hypothetical protein